MAAVTVASMRMRRAAERRGFYLWDALTQWLYWGGYVGLSRVDLHTNAGVSAGCAALLVLAAWCDRDPDAMTRAKAGRAQVPQKVARTRCSRRGGSRQDANSGWSS